jgi:hypothetical protein
MNDSLEFSISQYLDGSLPPEEVAALEARLKDDPSARELLAEYQRLDAMLKNSTPATPAIEWDRLAGQLSDAVQLEFSVSQYADGTLPTSEATSLEARLRDDSALQGSLAQHRGVNLMLKSAPLPAIRWERLAAYLCDTVADANERPSIKLFARPWVRATIGLAMAACVALASYVGIRIYLGRHGDPSNIAIGPNHPTQVAVGKPLEVEIGPAGTETTNALAVAEISIGAGPDPDNNQSPAFADGILIHSPRSLIATAAPTAQDTGQMPY